MRVTLTERASRHSVSFLRLHSILLHDDSYTNATDYLYWGCLTTCMYGTGLCGSPSASPSSSNSKRKSPYSLPSYRALCTTTAR